MDLVLLVKAILMGIVEGLTEFLPISSTGHLILAGSLLDFNDAVGKAKADAFEIAIQTGAILAVVWVYKDRLLDVLLRLGRDPKANRFAINVVIGFVPAVVLALLFSKAIKAHLFAPVPVAIAFIVGAFIILYAERLQARSGFKPRINDVDEMTWVDALKVGLVQCAALIPGTSRSGATIIGAMFFGLSRRAATDFSFFLGIPTLIGAGAYSLYKARDVLGADDIPLFGVGTLFSFIAAMICVRWLLRFISTHDFKVFAWYRIVFGVLILATAWYGLVDWHE
ncbi:undecaprenyl-diphosphate phosphatase [Derxia lacustris]|uniref:undecaprenyl-diphosphate phosphatase n=1 Tax=Derxia lacustris TaxID=764842 RepID=UPI000A16FC07|nr:undecaprenyl-diphosphate phosphatase [Derxia lacustris]